MTHRSHFVRGNVHAEETRSRAPSQSVGKECMPEYRIYRLDQAGHIVAPPDVVDCETDEEAVATAQTRLDGLDLEVWQEARRVTTLKSTENHG
jgi:hypothetical protein